MLHLPRALIVAALVAGCAAPARDLERIRPGMSRDEVVTIVGEPDTRSFAPGRECDYYALLKDFWSRVPWSLSERYVVCYAAGRVETFARVDSPAAG